MKRLLVTILALVYLGTATGTTLHLHYCMGKLADMSLWGERSNTCNKCGMEKADSWDAGCCKDDQKQIKLKDAHTQVATYSSITSLAPILLTTHFFLMGTYSNRITVIPYPTYDPPQRSDQTPIYLRGGVFLI